MKIKNIIKELSKINDSCKFVAINGYTTNKGETKNYLINFRADYKSAVEKSIIMAFKFTPSNSEESEARDSILNSLRQSALSKDVTKEVIFDGKPVKGLAKCGEKIFINGFILKQNYDANSVYDKIYNTLPVSKYRVFEISPNKMKSMVISGKTIKIS